MLVLLLTATYLLLLTLWSLSYQPGDFTCFASAASSDGTGSCTLYDADDVNFEFVSTVGTLYYVLVGSEATAGRIRLVFDCATVVEGCMNSALVTSMLQLT